MQGGVSRSMASVLAHGASTQRPAQSNQVRTFQVRGASFIPLWSIIFSCGTRFRLWSLCSACLCYRCSSLQVSTLRSMVRRRRRRLFHRWLDAPSIRLPVQLHSAPGVSRPTLAVSCQVFALLSLNQTLLAPATAIRTTSIMPGNLYLHWFMRSRFLTPLTPHKLMTAPNRATMTNIKAVRPSSIVADPVRPPTFRRSEIFPRLTPPSISTRRLQIPVLLRNRRCSSSRMVASLKSETTRFSARLSLI